MEFVLFVLAALFLILWLSASGKNKSNNSVDYQGKSYAQGYWDGYRARQKEVDQGVSPVQSANHSEQSVELNNTLALASESGDYVSTEAHNNTPIVDAAEQKAKRDLQNINTALYVASFLLVAAAALFIGTALPESVRFIGVWLVTILFYASGLYLHKNVSKLRPAAIAFVGTGLAILPFTGIAMYNLALPDAATCWFITSLIGVVAFMFAAVRLQSQVVAYFTIAFVISMATSSMATIGAGLIWYFVVLIALGSIMTLIAVARPNFIPNYFAKPIHQTDQWIVPLTLIASIFTASNLSLRDYWIITLVSGLYYATVAASSVLQTKEIALFMTRFLASLSIALVAFDITDSFIVLSIVMSVIGVLQVMISTALLPKRLRLVTSSNEIWLWLGFALQFFAPILLVGCEHWDVVLLFQLLALLVLGISSAYVLKRSELLSLGVFSLAVLPILAGLSLVEPALEPQFLALIFIGLGAAATALCSLQNIKKIHPSVYFALVASFAVFTVEALLFTVEASSAIGFAVWSVAALLTYSLVYREKSPGMVLVANFLALISIVWLVSLLGIPENWKALAVSWISFAVFYGTNIVLANISKKQYAVYFWWSAVVIAVFINLVNLMALSVSSSSDTGLIPVTVIGLVLVSIVMIFKGLHSQMYGLIDVGVIVATIALQRLVSLSAPGLDMLVYTHWWAITVGGLSLFYSGLGKYSSSQMRAIIALFFVTFFTGITALSAGSVGGNLDSNVPPYQMIFLVEHVIIMLFGLMNSRKLFSTWGAVGVALAVLWMLSGYTYVLLALVAFIIIGIAIYALVRQSKGLK